MSQPYSIHGRNDLDYDGYVVITEEVGHNPSHAGGTDYRGLRQIPIVRLNNGYGSAGTIPEHPYYNDFATRVANFVKHSPGCTRWIIGNEVNFSAEWPNEKAIWPWYYAECYDKCRDAIHALPGHEQDEVLVAAIAPWNIDTKYGGNQSGSWVQYFKDVQKAVKDVDGFAIHTYARQQVPESVIAETKMDAPYHQWYNGFQTYRDWMNNIALVHRGKPVYMTEMCIAGVPWQDVNARFITTAYAEIMRWNEEHPDRLIRCLTVYRWQYDRWTIKDKKHVLEDFMQAVRFGYEVPEPQPPDPEPPDPEPPEPQPPETWSIQVNVEIEALSSEGRTRRWYGELKEV